MNNSYISDLPRQLQQLKCNVISITNQEGIISDRLILTSELQDNISQGTKPEITAS